MSRVPVIGNASAKVSATAVPFKFKRAGLAAVESFATVKVVYLQKQSSLFGHVSINPTGLWAA